MSIIENDPIALFGNWFDEAKAAEPVNPNAMSVATVGADGRPSVRMVLLKGFDARGFVFYTNLGSRKAVELAENNHTALCFYWKSTAKQVRIEGPAEPVSVAEADAYFESRPKLSRIGAWASKQSQPLAGRFDLEKRVARFTAKFSIGRVPRPEFWSGFRVRPDCIEFWSEQTFRLHDRVLFVRDGETWTTSNLYP